jgi:hypothetical protein
VEVKCVCELADSYFTKRSAFGCGCRKRRKGQPKVAGGMCKIGAREHIFKARHIARDLKVASMAGRELEEADKTWPASKDDPKEYAVEKRDLNRRGEPVGEWYVYRKYRRQSDQLNAVDALRKGAGRRSEYRAA